MRPRPDRTPRPETPSSAISVDYLSPCVVLSPVSMLPHALELWAFGGQTDRDLVRALAPVVEPDVLVTLHTIAAHQSIHVRNKTVAPLRHMLVRALRRAGVHDGSRATAVILLLNDWMKTERVMRTALI